MTEKYVTLRLPSDEWDELKKLVTLYMSTDIPMSDNFVARMAVKAAIVEFKDRRSQINKGMPKKLTSKLSKHVPV